MIETADRLQGVGEYYFSRKLEQIRKMAGSGVPVINLGIGSPDLAPAPEVMDAAARTLHLKNTHGYMPYRSKPELREAIARWYERDFGVRVDPHQNVLPLLGSKEGILYLALAYLNPGDVALIPNPGYPAYASVTRMIGAVPRFYDLTDKNGWQPDFAELEKMDLSRCKLMWVNYPHMPSGACANEETYKKLIDFGRRKNILICHDNPYAQVLNESAPRSLLSLDPGFETSIELNSMSKAFNMAGWRVGMLLGHPRVVDAVLQVKSNVDSGMFSAIQDGAIEALRLPDEWHAERNQTYRARREIVWKIFDELGFAYDRGAVGLFVWAKAPDRITDVEKHLDVILEQARVFLVPGSTFGSNGARFARASLCADIKILHEALARIQKVKK